MSDRFIVIKESQSGHCCFEVTVIDATRPLMVDDQQVGCETVCECFEVEDADRIARAMNMAVGLTEVLPLAHDDFLNLDPFVKGRPVWRSADRGFEQIWPEPDGEYQMFIRSAEHHHSTAGECDRG